MKSLTTPDFRERFHQLRPELKRRAQLAYRLWLANPRHPSLCFKKVGELWSVRIGKGHRALAVLQGDTYYWFWIGSHDDYDRLLDE